MALSPQFPRLPEPVSGDADEFATDDIAGREAETRQWAVGAEDHGQRLDKALVLRAPEFSRSHLQGLIARACVIVDGQPADSASRKLRLGQTVSVHLLPTAQAQAFKPEAQALDILFEDEHLIVPTSRRPGWCIPRQGTGAVRCSTPC